jgi:cobalamin synthase
MKLKSGRIGYALLILVYAASWEMLAVLGALPLFNASGGEYQSFFQKNIWALVIFVLLAARITVLFAEDESLKVKLGIVLAIAAVVLSTVLVIQTGHRIRIY